MMKILVTLYVGVDRKEITRLFNEIPRRVREGEDMVLQHVASSIFKYSGLANTEVQPLILG